MRKRSFAQSLLFPFLLFLLITTLSCLRIHGSSVGIYNLFFYGANYKDPNLIFGHVQPIRWDEWAVETPWILALSEAKFDSTKIPYAAGQDLSLTDVPVDNWGMVFEPQNWSFMFFPIEQAFAFKWWFKGFILATSVYVLLLMITKNDILLSIMGAISLVYAPFFQWWYSTSAEEITSFAILTFIFFIRVLNDDKYLLRLVNTLFLIYFSICFSLTLYPPFQIPLAMFLIFSGIGYTYSQREILTPARIRELLIFALLSTTLIIGTVFLYIFAHEPAFNAIRETVYPGNRLSTGGDLPVTFMLGGFYNIQLLFKATNHPDLINNSEASSFFLFSLFLIPLFISSQIRSVVLKTKLDLPILLPLAYILMLIVWGIIGLPAIVAKIFLFTYVPPRRAMIMLGLANHLLIAYYLCRFKIAQTREFKIFTIFYSLAVFLVVLWVGVSLGSDFIDNKLVLLIIASICGGMMLMLLNQKRIAFGGMFLAMTLISTMLVNPVYRGLSPLRESRLSIIVDRIQQEHPQSVWVSYGDYFPLSNYLAANGAPVINGTYYYPNLNFWHHFDQEQIYRDIYNRYSHIFFSTTNDDAVTFELIQSDAFRVYINPCNAILRELNTRYYVFTKAVNYSCLSLVNDINFDKIRFFIYIRTDF